MGICGRLNAEREMNLGVNGAAAKSFKFYIVLVSLVKTARGSLQSGVLDLENRCECFTAANNSPVDLR
jgi:hypothetical protein